MIITTNEASSHGGYGGGVERVGGTLHYQFLHNKRAHMLCVCVCAHMCEGLAVLNSVSCGINGRCFSRSACLPINVTLITDYDKYALSGYRK